MIKKSEGEMQNANEAAGRAEIEQVAKATANGLRAIVAI